MLPRSACRVKKFPTTTRDSRGDHGDLHNSFGLPALAQPHILCSQKKRDHRGHTSLTIAFPGLLYPLRRVCNFRFTSPRDAPSRSEPRELCISIQLSAKPRDLLRCIIGSLQTACDDGWPSRAARQALRPRVLNMAMVRAWRASALTA